MPEDKIDKIFSKLDDMSKVQSNIQNSVTKIETNYQNTAKTVDEHDLMLTGDPARQGKGGIIYTLMMVKKEVALITAGVSLAITVTVTFIIGVFKHKTGG